MKRNILKSFVAILLFAVLVPVFQSCSDDDDQCRLTVVVKNAKTGERVAGASIHIGKDAGTITRDDVSNANGEAYFVFDNEAIFDVNASYGVAPNTQSGLSRVQLKKGERVTSEVLIQ